MENFKLTDKMTPAEWDAYWMPLDEQLGKMKNHSGYVNQKPRLFDENGIFDPDYYYTMPVNDCDKASVCARRKDKMFHFYCFICTRKVKQDIERMARTKVFKYWNEHKRGA
jgi:hypothetical protein